jgi:hypothetical protein
MELVLAFEDHQSIFISIFRNLMGIDLQKQRWLHLLLVVLEARRLTTSNALRCP